MIRTFFFFALLLMCGWSQAFTVNIGSGTRMVYLRVGDGAFTGLYNSGGIPGNSSTVNLASVTVPAASIGNNVPLVFTSNATQPLSYYDNYAFCNLPNEVYIGGFFRRPNGSTGSAVLTVTAPVNLVDADGDLIPFSQINWQSSGNGDGTATQPVPSGAFAGGVQTLATFPGNSWRESCHRFFYQNAQFVAAGVYRGRVVYTLSAP